MDVGSGVLFPKKYFWNTLKTFNKRSFKLMAKQKSNTRKIGRDAGTGKFIPVKDAERRKKTAVVETIKKKK